MIVYIHKCSSLKILSHDSLYSIWLSWLVPCIVSHMRCIIPLLVIQGPPALASSCVGSLHCNFSAWQLNMTRGPEGHIPNQVNLITTFSEMHHVTSAYFTELHKTPSSFFHVMQWNQIRPLKWIESFRFTATNTFPPRFSNLLFFLPSNVQKVH